jgi:hypothetical protein
MNKKILGNSLIFFQVFVCVIFSQNISLAQKSEKSLLQTSIQADKILDKTLSKTLSNLSRVYKIPVSFEPKVSDSLNNDIFDTKTSFDIKKSAIK